MTKIPTIQPKQLAMYYEAICGYDTSYTGTSPTRQLAFDSIHNLQTAKWNMKDSFTPYTPMHTSSIMPTSAKSSGSAYEMLRQSFIKHQTEEYQNGIAEKREANPIPSPWSDEWGSYNGDGKTMNLGNALLKARDNIKYTVTKNYFEVLAEIHDRVKGMIEECGTDVCQGLVDILLEINKVLELGEGQKWNEEEEAYMDFNVQVAFDLGQRYDKVMKDEKKRLEEIPAIRSYNDALNKSKYDVFSRLERTGI